MGSEKGQFALNETLDVNKDRGGETNRARRFVLQNTRRSTGSCQGRYRGGAVVLVRVARRVGVDDSGLSLSKNGLDRSNGRTTFRNGTVLEVSPVKIGPKEASGVFLFVGA